MQHIAFDYGVCKSTVCESVHWVKETLVKSGVFHLPSKKELHSNPSIDILLVDATEVEIECPKKNKNSITQRKRKNTPQIVVDAEHLNVVCFCISKGKCHDFNSL